jgi:hypothetical protein
VTGPGGQRPTHWLDADAEPAAGGAPAGAQGGRGAAVVYEAFVATSTQHTEFNSCQRVDAAAVAAALVGARGRFAHAAVEARPYDEVGAVRAARAAGLPFRDRMKWPLHPHRVLSLFSTYARAVGLARGREATLGARFELGVISRADLFFHYVRGLVPPRAPQLLPGAPPRAPRGWLQAVAEAGAIGRRKRRAGAWEDRLLAGRREFLFALARLPEVFLRRFRALGDQSWPEVHIALLLAEAGATRNRSASRGPFFEDYVRLSGFRQNKAKYRPDYIKLPAAELADAPAAGEGETGTAARRVPA